jgi:hypothetical protein
MFHIFYGKKVYNKINSLFLLEFQEQLKIPADDHPIGV